MSRDNDSQRMRRRWPEWLLPGFYLPSWLVSVGFHLIVFALLAFWFQRAVDSGGADADDRFVTIFVKPSPDAAELRETPESSPDTEPEETDNTAPTEEVSDLDLDPLLDEPPAIEEIPLLGPIGDVVDQLPNASTQFAAPKRNSGVDVVASQGETKFMGIKDRGTRFVYVVDCSGSMYKHNAINVAKAELRQSISYLDATRQFQVIFYNSEPLPWRPEGRSRDIFYATDANKQRIDQFIGSIDPNHGTHHMPAIMMALKLHPEVLYLLTDAHEPSLTATQLSLIKKRNKGRTRIHTIEFGIGPQIVRENFLTRLARQNGGDSRYLDVTKFDRVGETERRRNRFRYQSVLLQILILYGLCGTMTSNCFAKDRVELRHASGNATITISGTIVEYTGREIQIQRNEREEPRDYATENVVRISYTKTPEHTAAIRLMDENQTEQALEASRMGLAKEPRTWVRREILALQVQCAVRLGDYASAAAKFLTIAESDPDTVHFRHIPVLWNSQILTDNDQNSARQWLDSDSETARLIGASLLLADSTQGALAQTQMTDLTSSTDPRVQSLAIAQLWRTAIATQKVSPQDIERWDRQLSQIPSALRGGPHYLIGQAYFLRGEYEQAARSLLWLPLVYDDERLLAARACLEAAISLQRIGKKKQAHRLYLEVSRRFEDTAYAGEANRALSGMKQTWPP